MSAGKAKQSLHKGQEMGKQELLRRLVTLMKYKNLIYLVKFW